MRAFFFNMFYFFLTILTVITIAQTIDPSIAAGFSINLLYPALNHPMSFCFHPTDGRTLIVLKQGQILVTPCCLTNKTSMKVFLDISKTSRLSTVGDGGLFSASFDPFDQLSKYIYVQYLQKSPALDAGVADRTVISRFTMDPTNSFAAISTSEKIIFQHTVNVKGQINHFGGGLIFGSDGFLYSSSGVASITPYTMAQDLSSSSGKVVRIDKDGVTIPSQNPFFSSSGTSATTNSIFALGFRNPYTMTRSLESNDIYISDVGEKAWEEINLLAKGSNYGWPSVEGKQKLAPLEYTDPFLAYPHEGSGSTVRGCCIVGTVEYRVSMTFDAYSFPFPTIFQGRIFFIEFCGGWINIVNIGGSQGSSRFASGFKSPVALAVNPYDGALYVATEMGDVFKISNTAALPPQAIYLVSQPKDLTIFAGDMATFTVKISTTKILNVRWQMMRAGSRTWLSSTNYVGEALSFQAVETDSGNAYRAVIFNDDNTTLISAVATLVVKPAPLLFAVIDDATIGTSYFAGQKFTIKGNLQSSLTGLITPAIQMWSVTLKHGFHSHALFSSTVGTLDAPLPFVFSAPISGEFDFNQSLLISFQATTADGLSFSTSRDLVPVAGYLKIKTFPPGLKVSVNGVILNAPLEIRTVAGMIFQIGPPPDRLCLSWTDGGFGNNGTRMYGIPLSSANRIITIKLI